jgi:hypothetical protein
MFLKRLSIMKKIILSTLAIFLASTCILAQNVNTDSLKLLAKISEDKVKLGKLINQVDDKTKNKLNASVEAQKSADDNAKAALKLTDDPENKKLAKNAENKADDAKADSRDARKEAVKYEKLNDEIRKLRIKILKEENEMTKYTTKGIN